MKQCSATLADFGVLMNFLFKLQKTKHEQEINKECRWKKKKFKKKNADGQRWSTNRKIRMRTISDFSSKTMQQKEWSGLFKALIEKK